MALHIAILGTRGIPARYGGFETFADELSAVLSGRGHQVTVYCRRRFFDGKTRPDRHGEVRLRYIPTIMQKYLETPLHGLLSMVDLWFRNFDVILLCNAANSPFAWIGRARGFPIAINVDGIERERTKWSKVGKLWYLLGEKCSVWFASRVVADAHVIGDYYKERYNCESDIIAYGAKAVRRPAGAALKQFGLIERGYILYVSRLEPENNALGVIKAYSRVNTTLPLVIVGDAPYAEDYKRSLRLAAEGSRVVFTGFQFGEAYQELQSNCYCYVQATEVGGTHPALIEAMAYGNCVIANGTPENREVLGETGMIYSKNDFSELSGLFEKILNEPETAREFGALAKERAEKVYNWEAIADLYERLFARLCS
ncbi:MAG: glycosyltransferase [Deltaproteobacteria bacterium]|nr:glycosyltransferase [Deltaproteobacteria bacterium]